MPNYASEFSDLRDGFLSERGRISDQNLSFSAQEASFSAQKPDSSSQKASFSAQKPASSKKLSPESPSDDAPVQIAIRRPNKAKTPKTPLKTPQKANPDSEGAVKIHFSAKNKTPSAPVGVSKVNGVNTRTSTVSGAISISSETISIRRATPIKAPKKRSLKVKVVEDDEPSLELPVSQDLDLEEVFEAIEQGKTPLYDPLEHFADAPVAELIKTQSIPGSAQLKVPSLSQPKTSGPAIAKLHSVTKTEAPASVKINTSSPAKTKTPTPFVSYEVDKRPLSSARPIATPNNVITEKNLNQPIPDAPTPRGDLGSLKPKPVTTDIAAAPKKTSATIGLFIAILLTVIAGGFVGALIYFLFFQEA